MGGKQSSKVTEIDIQNEINIELTNETTNITKILNETVTNITSNIITKRASEIRISQGNDQRIEITEIYVGENANFKIFQTISTKYINEAVVQISSDTTALTDMANTIITDIQNKLKNNSDLQSSLKTANSLKSTTTDDGGIASMVRIVGDVIKTALSSGDIMTEENITKIKNIVKTVLKNITINDTSINNIIRNTVTSNIEKNDKSMCIFSFTNNQQINFGRVVVDRNAKFELSQILSVDSYNTCIIEIIDTTSLTNSMTNAQTNNSISDITHDSIVKAVNDAKNTIVKEEVYKDPFVTIFSNLGNNGYIVCIMFIIAFVFMGLLKKKGQ